MTFLVSYAPLLIKGIGITATAWVLTSVGSVLGGTILGILSSRSLNLPYLSRVIRAYTFVAKGIPAYVQILIAYFVLPSLLHISLSGFAAASLALILCSVGYMTEIIRAGMNAIPQGQWDACTVLGYSRLQALRFIIVPQAFAMIWPALMGEVEQLLKSTSLFATIGVTELTRVGMNIISRELTPLPVYMTIAGIYIGFSALLILAGTFIERKKLNAYRY